jgi:superfamily I DNA/RNA helicase
VIRPEEWRPQGIDDLELAAWRALHHPGSVCVVAGPGAGKTEFLAQKATYLLQTGLCPTPRQILAISFKRDAADNLLKRVRKRCPPEQARRFTSITFDAFTKSLVDRFFPAIAEEWQPSRPYDIFLPKYRDYDDFLTRSRLAAPGEWQAEVAALPVNTFESRVVGAARLASPPADPRNGETFAIRRWLDERLANGQQSRVTFIVLNRIAELLLRTRPHILRALRTTYPIVFVDEFQDTTYSQYDFLLTTFHSSQAAITAVGDDKQRIMVWAGARPDSFARFQQDFGAVRESLIFNHRSSPALVRIQHVIAKALDAEAPEVVSQIEGKIDGDVAEIWCFSNEADEANQLANWISEDSAARGLGQREYAVLVRQTADVFEEQLAGPFTDAGLRLRNESRAIGRTTLQDLLAEEITRIVTGIMRLAVQRRAPQAWSFVADVLGDLLGTDYEDAPARRRIEAELKAAITDLGQFLEVQPPSAEVAAELVARILRFVDLGAVARIYPEYGSGEDLEIAAEAISLYMRERAEAATTWLEVVDEFEGVEQVPLMTVHKSKGLEYDTILFVGLDDKMWWSHKVGGYEGRATFFVGLSRAKQRAIFTYCKTRGSRKGVSDLYDLLAAAGVPEKEF